MQQKQSIALAFALGLLISVQYALPAPCGPATAQLDQSFNTAGIFSGIPGTAEISQAVLVNAPSRAEGIALSPDGTVVLGGVKIDPSTSENFFAAAKVTTSGTLIWQTVLPSPALLTFSEENLVRVVVDPLGYVYLNGTTTDSAFAAAKLDSAGMPIWTAIFSKFSANSSDRATDVAVDTSGCIYLGGYTIPSGANSVFAAIKLDSASTPIWTATVPHFSAGSGEGALGITLDQDGCVYLGGATVTPPPGERILFATVKLSSTGIPIWTSIVPRFSSGSADIAYDIVLDPSGSVYLGGSIMPPGELNLFAAAKLSSTGTPIWTSVVPRFSSDSRDQAFGIALDSSGFVYLGGSTQAIATGPLLAAAKLSNTGAPIWTAIVPSLQAGIAYDVTVDSLAHVYLGGTNLKIESMSSNFAAAVLSQTNGDVEEAASIPFKVPSETVNPLQFFGISVDAEDNIILGGKTFSVMPSVSNFVAHKLSSIGTPVWNTVVSHFSSGSEDSARAVAVDPSGYVYLGGFTKPTTANDQMAALELNNLGTPIWTTVIPYFSSGSREQAEGIAVDKSGCVYLGGLTRVGALPRMAAAKLSNTGALSWTAIVPFGLALGEAALDISLDASGCVYVGGVANLSSGPSFAAAKLSNAGTPIWTAIIPQFSSGSEDTAFGIALDESGFIYLGGSTKTDTDDLFFAAVKLSNTGAPIWTSVIPSFGTPLGDVALGAALDQHGCFYLGGEANTDTPELLGTAFAAAKIDANGNLVWQFLAPSFNSFGTAQGAQGIVVDSNGAVVLGGYFMQNNEETGSIGGIVKLLQQPPLSPSVLLQFFVAMAAA